ncbi:MAG TPA: tetratricopeptide repeat protein, partial [Blastocatellia bacterium]|nr:tetratricopeptide repeat protein [Blastocatellia bacterium]
AQLPEVQLALGDVLTALGRTDQGIEQYKAVLAKNAQSYEAMLGLAGAYEDKEQYADAENYYHQAISLRPNDWVALNELGSFYFAQGRYQDAADKWQQVASLASLNPVGFANLGLAYYALGKLADAEKAYRDSLQIRFTIAAKTNLGVVLFERGDYKNAATEFKEACDKAPRRIEVWGNYADSLRAIERRDEAIAAYDQAIKLVRERLQTAPRDAEYISLLAEYLAKCDEDQEALKNIEQALTIKRSVSLKSAVIVYALSNHQSDALQLLSEALSSELYNVQTFDNAPELAELRVNPEYKRVTQPYRDHN